MSYSLEHIVPTEIEKRSFEIIQSELSHSLNPELAPIIKRVIHASADFDYADNLYFSDDVVKHALAALTDGACIVTDTNMAKAGINQKELKKYGGDVFCFMADEDIIHSAKENGTTRASASMDKACQINRPLIFAIGNAPTALIRLYELIKLNRISPRLIIGAPVGFVNVIQSKELIMKLEIPCIVARGRKGGSSITAAICNALLYMLGRS